MTFNGASDGASVSLTSPSTPDRLHILLLSFPAFGHIIPMLEFAKKLSQHHAVTFGVSAGKLPDLTRRELLHPTEDPVRLLGIPDNVWDDFDNPEDSDAILRIFLGVNAAVENLLTAVPLRHDPGRTSSAVPHNSGRASSDVPHDSGRPSSTVPHDPGRPSSAVRQPVDVIILDLFLGGPVGVCRSRSVPFYFFNAANAMFFQHLLLLNEGTPTVSIEEADAFIELPEPGGQLQAFTVNMKTLFLPVRNNLGLAKGIIINTLRELEPDLLRDLHANPPMPVMRVWCVGPLFPEETSTTTENSVPEWLNRQSDGSVVYVSFGSVATPTGEQIRNIGLALLESKRPFLWSLRAKFHSFLPDELRHRTNDGGSFLVTEWAPQKLVLKSPAVGVFLSHCGWNSTLEAVAGGKAMIAWPMFADQLLNAQWAVRLGVAVLIPKTGMKAPRVVPVDEITAAIMEVGGVWSGSQRAGTVYQTSVLACSEKVHAAWGPSGKTAAEFEDLLSSFR
ncbi:putative UDP-glycosyltransferase 72B1 [Hypsibius exemplaris]|uniref:UDP-glycosyltransferase 72B1 n=1 Tax=Hypsibius exemplaris TaxID=2072580 RepID=A0A1W0WYX3_HYPEX|nr:putative UDP-glycosyltransferase 72B1 [Hypsibius exemplaris]